MIEEAGFVLALELLALDARLDGQAELHQRLLRTAARRGPWRYAGAGCCASTICALSNCSMASGPLIGTVMVCFRWDLQIGN